MKNVLITSSTYLPNIGGIENSLYYLAKAGNNDNVIIVSSDIINTVEGSSRREELNCRIIRYHVPKNKNKILRTILNWKNAINVYKQVKKEGCDVVISRYHFSTLLCYIAGLRNINYLVPGVVKYQAALENTSKFSSAIIRNISYYYNCYLQYLAFKVSDRVFVFSENMEKQVHSVDKSCNVIKTSPGVDSERFYYIQDHSHSVVNLLIVARLTGSKNINIAIESLLYLPDNYILTIVGDGPLLEELKTLSAKLNLEERIKFEGAQADVVSYYSRAQLFLLPSVYESFGQTLLESSSCGIPTVAFHSSIVKTATVDILADYGIYAHELNPKSYGEAILRAYYIYYDENKISRQSLRDYIIEKYSWDHLYNKIVKGG